VEDDEMDGTGSKEPVTKPVMMAVAAGLTALEEVEG